MPKTERANPKKSTPNMWLASDLAWGERRGASKGERGGAGGTLYGMTHTSGGEIEPANKKKSDPEPSNQKNQDDQERPRRLKRWTGELRGNLRKKKSYNRLGRLSRR